MTLAEEQLRQHHARFAKSFAEKEAFKNRHSLTRELIAADTLEGLLLLGVMTPSCPRRGGDARSVLAVHPECSTSSRVSE